MSIVSIFCFLVAGLILISYFRRGSDVFSPAKVFLFVWAIAIGLTDLKFSRLQHQWENYAWLCLFLSIGSFLLGIFIVQVLFTRLSLYPVSTMRKIILNEKINHVMLYRLITGLFLLYVIVYIVEWVSYGTLPLFAAFPDRARSEIPITGLHLFIGAMPIILFLVLEYYILVRAHYKNKIILAIYFIITLLSYLFFLNRLYYVLFFIMALGFMYYASRHVRIRNILISATILFGLMVFLQYFRETRYVENFLYVVSEMKYTSEYAVFTGPYMYIVMNLENFARAVVRLENFTYGYFSFDFLMALSGLKHWLSSYFGLHERVFLVSGYNTFPFFWDYYYDFGLIGLSFLSCLLGVFTSLLHKYMRHKPSIVSISMYSMMLFVVIFSFFTNALTSLNFVFNFVLLFVSQKLIERKQITDLHIFSDGCRND
ncbi:MAG: O-antigen polymerase [Bacteroidota bacterium]|nr:O-antigen polymerase [Bacteroidota bacterium]